jgi:phosphoglycerate-specific signal transduction histidine kinase
VTESAAYGTLASVTVRDTGIGIPSDKVEAVFAPFVQVGKGLNREGAGLGLSVSREVARARQVDLTAQSTLGKGSALNRRIAVLQFSPTSCAQLQLLASRVHCAIWSGPILQPVATLCKLSSSAVSKNVSKD